MYNQIATEYCDISENYLMKSVSSLVKLLSIDNDVKMEEVRQLKIECNATLSKIKEMMMQKNECEVNEMFNFFLKLYEKK